MIQTERERLFAHQGQYLNIGITETGAPQMAVAIPWSGHSSACNMRTPNIYLQEADLYDDEILDQLDRFTVLGFYAFCGLKDYSVLGRFTHLQDICLYDAKHLRDLSFMTHTPDWFMLLIEGATLPDLLPLIHPEHQSKVMHSYCLGLFHCRVADISALAQSGLRLRELLICNADPAEKRRWQGVKAMSYRYTSG